LKLGGGDVVKGQKKTGQREDCSGDFVKLETLAANRCNQPHFQTAIIAHLTSEVEKKEKSKEGILTHEITIASKSLPHAHSKSEHVATMRNKNVQLFFALESSESTTSPASPTFGLRTLPAREGGKPWQCAD
jgi:hypothetical protein